MFLLRQILFRLLKPLIHPTRNSPWIIYRYSRWLRLSMRLCNAFTGTFMNSSFNSRVANCVPLLSTVMTLSYYQKACLGCNVSVVEICLVCLLNCRLSLIVRFSKLLILLTVAQTVRLSNPRPLLSSNQKYATLPYPLLLL